MKRKYITLLFLLACAISAYAQQADALTIDELEPVDVLAVFAHPDDETMCAGTLAKLAEAGRSIQLVYATSGEAASADKSGRGLTGPPLAEEREREMACAAAALGIEQPPLFLRFPDGGVYEERDDATARMKDVFLATKPKVALSFGPDGGYGHPDHIAIGWIVERAFDATGVSQRFLNVTLSKKRFETWLEITGSDRFRPVADDLIALTVDVRGYLEQRVAAMACHATQFDANQRAGFKVFAERTGTEEFVLARRRGKQIDGVVPK